MSTDDDDDEEEDDDEEDEEDEEDDDEDEDEEDDPICCQSTPRGSMRCIAYFVRTASRSSPHDAVKSSRLS